MQSPQTPCSLNIPGRRPGRLGLETRARRGLPYASLPTYPVHYGWQWCPIVCHGWSHARVCAAWILVALQPGVFGHCYDDLLDTLWRVIMPLFYWLYLALIPFALRVGGYFSSRVYASLGGTDRRKNAFLTATILPA